MYVESAVPLLMQTVLVLVENSNGTLPNPIHAGEETERCFLNYGCFTIAYPWTCKNRPHNYFPMPPASMAVRYPMYTRRNRKTPVYLYADNIKGIWDANVDAAGPFYFISHGFLEDGHKPWIQEMTQALLNIEGNDGATVIAVDWQGGSQPPYGQAVANIRLVGVMTAHLIKKIYDALGLSDVDNFHFIGHSLGAHLAGYCGYALRKDFHLKLGRITGMDPAGPHFAGTVSMMHLNKDDAKFVDIIHTHAKPLIQSAGLGIQQQVGHVDFYPNGGSDQPGCGMPRKQGSIAELSPTIMAMLGCHHVRSYEYFTESITNTCPFMGVQCDSYEEFLAGECATCDQKHACIPMGYYSYQKFRALQEQGLILKSNITLYSITGSRKPFCRSQYKVMLKVSEATKSQTHGPELGQVAITLVDRNNNMSEPKFMDEKIYYKPGDIQTRMIAVRDKGLPPQFVIAEFKYDTNLFNPMTWRVLKAPKVHVDYIKISSIEYNTDITVCPKLKRPVVQNLPTVMKTNYCV